MKEKKARILLVDDDPGNILILSHILEKKHSIVTADNGVACLDIVHSENPPDLIILDIMMPDMDGYEVCSTLQAGRQTRNIPVIFITGLDSIESQSKGLALGAVDYLVKPFNSAIVLARTKTHLKIKRQRDLLLQRQQELNLVNQKNEMILNTAAEGIYGVDQDDKITFMNPAALKMIGLREDEVLGKHSCEIMHNCKEDGEKNPDRKCTLKQKMIHGPGKQNDDFLFWRKDGTSFSVEYVAAPAMQNGEIMGVVVVFKDITERKQMEGELLRIDKLHAFEVLAGGIAHDFNNILAVTLGFLELTKMNVQPGEKIEKYIDDAFSSTIQARDLAAKFLTISQCYLKKQEKAHIAKTIDQVLESIQVSDNIIFKINIPDQTRPLRASQPHIEQLLKNIFVNGLEAMPGGGTIQVTVCNCPDGSKEHSSLVNSPHLKISVHDQGKGIPTENHQKIFDPYFSTKPKSSKRGVGLGLTVCQAIVKSHHGHIEIQSASGQGTTVLIYLPVDENSMVLA